AAAADRHARRFAVTNAKVEPQFDREGDEYVEVTLVLVDPPSGRRPGRWRMRSGCARRCDGSLRRSSASPSTCRSFSRRRWTSTYRVRMNKGIGSGEAGGTIKHPRPPWPDGLLNQRERPAEAGGPWRQRES